MAFFTELKQKILKFVLRQGFQIPKAILRKKNTAVGIRLLDFRLYRKARVIRPVLYWHKTRNKDQRIRIESIERYPHTYGQLIYEKGGKTIQ